MMHSRHSRRRRLRPVPTRDRAPVVDAEGTPGSSLAVVTAATCIIEEGGRTLVRLILRTSKDLARGQGRTIAGLPLPLGLPVCIHAVPVVVAVEEDLGPQFLEVLRIHIPRPALLLRHHPHPQKTPSGRQSVPLVGHAFVILTI